MVYLLNTKVTNTLYETVGDVDHHHNRNLCHYLCHSVTLCCTVFNPSFPQLHLEILSIKSLKGSMTKDKPDRGQYSIGNVFDCLLRWTQPLLPDQMASDNGHNNLNTKTSQGTCSYTFSKSKIHMYTR